MDSLARAVALAAAVFSLGLSGCLAAAAGAAAGLGVYAYARGEAWSDVYGSLDATYQASLTALDELGLTVVQWSKDPFGAHVKATEADGGDVTVELVPAAEHVTKVGIRVGTFGDEEKARRILKQIQDNL